MKRTSILYLLVFLVGYSSIAQTKWVIDKNHTNIRFNVVHLVISEVEGQFKDFQGTVVSNSEDFVGAEVEFVAQAASVDTDNDYRDKDLRSERFLHAEEYPEIKFSGTLTKEGDQMYLEGDFTLRGVTKQIKFKTTYNGTVDLGDRGKKAGFKVTGTINRFDYGVKFDSVMDSGELTASKEVDITCNIELGEDKGS